MSCCGEEILAPEPLPHEVLMGGDVGGIAVVDQEPTQGRVEPRVRQRLADLDHVDRADLRVRLAADIEGVSVQHPSKRSAVNSPRPPALPPRADEGGQAGQGPERVGPVAVVLHADHEPEGRRPRRRVAAGQVDDLGRGEPGDGRHPLRRVLADPRGEPVEAHRVPAHVVRVVKPSRTITFIRPRASAASVLSQ